MVTRARFTLVLVAWCILSLLAVTTASAALIVVGSVNYDGQACQLIYDEEQDITWLDYTRPSANRSSQDTWAQGLSFTIGGVTYDNWRLPMVTDTTPTQTHTFIGTSSTPSDAQKNSSEMAYLYYNQLGGFINNPPESYSLFEHIQNNRYWSGTLYFNNTSFAWVFDFAVGAQVTDSVTQGHPALAVHDGRIAIPIPGSALLLGSGLFGLLVLRGRSRKNRN